MKRPLLLATAALALVGLSASAFATDTYVLDPAHTQAMFTIDHIGFSTITEIVHDLKGTLLLDPAKPKNSTVEVTLSAASVDTGWDARDKDLKSQTFFNVAQFPTMTFKSTRVIRTGAKTADIRGEFTLLGVTRPLT